MPTASVDPLYKLLRDWAKQIFNTEQSLGIKIIESNQNVPKAEVDNIYLVIDYTSGRGRIGRGSHSKADKITAKSTIKNNFLNTISITEVNGNGDLLEELIETTDRQDIVDLFNDRGFAFLTAGDVGPVPRLPEGTWKKESIVEMNIHSGKTIEYDSGYINNAEANGTIPAQGRSGDHNVQNTITGG